MNKQAATLERTGKNPQSKKKAVTIYRYLKRYWFIYLLIIPGLLHKIIFSYVPMYGILIAFKKYEYMKGVAASKWVGFKNFEIIFRDNDFYRVLLNTVLINVYNILFGTVFVIILALMLNEIKIKPVKSIFQTAVYLPNFLSWVVFAGLITIILSPSDGIVNNILISLGFDPIYFLGKPQYFRTILVCSGLIKSAGFNTIIYLAAISGISPELYECAILDGAHRGQMMWHITLPRIKPTIAVLLILSVSNLFGSNFEQVFNLYSPLVYETGDVLSTFIYRRGLLDGKLEMATALGLIFSVIGVITIFVTNKFIKKMDVMGIL